MIEITPGVFVDPAHIEERFVRASGPGGQNVNKLSSAVELRFNLAAALYLPEAMCWRLGALAGRRLNKDGFIVIQAQSFRTQERNRADAMGRLAEMFRLAAEPPPPPRKKTRAPRSAHKARLTAKKVRSGHKALRKSPRGDD
ncbi:MAG: aminoacyl-tRNA hydrolase [Hyphomicrobiales bacterium]|nr:aminoacyl-tRNA hydrolase [Hyphomicrobiales bacterium]